MKNQFTYRDFTYLLDENNNHKVICNPIKSEPEEVYKYYSISENSIRALQNLSLYSTHPFLFNDSIDSSELILDFKNISKERYISFYKQMIIPEEFAKYDFDKNFEDDKTQNFFNIRNFAFTHFSRKIGIISLTTKPFNILMWSHYTNETGFVLELNTKKLLTNFKSENADVNNYCFRPIQYVENIEFMDAFAENFTSPDIPLLYITNIKRNDWQYEDEWRLSIYKNDMGIPFSKFYLQTEDFPGTNNRFFKYSFDTIESISLGKHFFNGKNCESLVDGNILKLYNRDDNDNKKNDLLFNELVNHLFEKHNDHLYMSGEYEDGNTLKRSLGKIKLEKVSEYTFKLIDLNQVVIMD